MLALPVEMQNTHLEDYHDFFAFCINFWLYVIVCNQKSTHHRVCVGVRGHLAGLGSFLPPCEFQGSNSYCNIWQQASSPANPLCSPVGIKLTILCQIIQMIQNHISTEAVHVFSWQIYHNCQIWKQSRYLSR